MRIYLSPHHDDVCFSLGHLASRQGGELVNLFTRSNYVAAELALPDEPGARIQAVTARRLGEDERFAKAAGLRRSDLGLEEPSLVGLGPFELTDLVSEVDLLAMRLQPVLSALLDGHARPAALYCPMGIGGHRNHLSTLMVVRRACEALCRRCAVFLYEDLHYASVRQAREIGLQRAAKLFAGYRLSPGLVRLEPQEVERKMAMIAFYASQHGHAPHAREYTPASGAAPGPHEMVWRVSSMDADQS